MRLNMFKLLLVALVLPLLAACGKQEDSSGSPVVSVETVQNHQSSYPAQASTVFGGWSAPDQQNNGMNFKLTMFIAASKVGVLVICESSDGSRLSAFVETPATVTSSTITINRGAEASKDIGDKHCHASIEAGTTSYSMMNDQIVMGSGNLSRAY